MRCEHPPLFKRRRWGCICIMNHEEGVGKEEGVEGLMPSISVTNYCWVCGGWMGGG